MMKKTFIIPFFIGFCSVNIFAGARQIDLKKITNGGDRTETVTDPKVNYDDENNSVEVAIDANQMFQMRVIDLYGTVVYTCPVLIIDGTPTKYQLPDLPAGIYTLKVDSPDVSYEGTLVIE